MWSNGQRGRRVRGVVVGAVLVALSVLGTMRATAPPSETTLERAEVHRDGDLVVYVAKAAGAAAPAVTGNGFATYGDATLLEHYTVRLVDSPDVERLRPHVDAVAAAMRGQVGQSVTVAAGTVPADTNGRGQIDVRVSTTAPCSGAWLGCATPIIAGGEIVQAEVWIHPRMLERSAASLDNVVRHELGHAFGLAHHDGEHEGRIQTMHSTSFDATAYRSGDLAGLRHVAVHASAPTSAPGQHPEPTPPPEPSPAPEPAPPANDTAPVAVDPTGAASVQAGSIGIVVRGHAVDPESDEPLTVTISLDGGTPFGLSASLREAAVPGHGFEAVWSVEPGTHEVCVVAHNVGRGHDVSLGCHPVVVTEGGIARQGLQTI